MKEDPMIDIAYANARAFYNLLILNETYLRSLYTSADDIGCYTEFKIPKKKGGFRIIQAPEETLKDLQRMALKSFKFFIPVSPYAHAFRAGGNIVTMAMPHVGKQLVASFDIKDFFPSIVIKDVIRFISKSLKKACVDYADKYKGVRRDYMLEATKISNDIVSQTLLMKKLLGIHRDLVVNEGGKIETLPVLPQGAPTSPFLSNVHMNNFDWFAAREAELLNVSYSRYADDMTFSGDIEAVKSVVSKVLYSGRLLHREGLTINDKKTKFMGRGTRQYVCGLVVNDKVNLPRRWRRKLRAALHQSGGEPSCMRDKGRVALNNMVATTVEKNSVLGDSKRRVLLSDLLN
jgi:hypothetical protein